MIILSPIALFFLASFLLTRPWYIRVGSLPALFLGAIIQPLFTATIFAAGIYFAGQELHGETSRDFESVLLVSFLFTLVIATPLSLIGCLAPAQLIRTQRESPLREIQDAGFVVFFMAGLISLICAILAVATVFTLAS